MMLSKDCRVDTLLAASASVEALSSIGRAESSYLPEDGERGTLIAVDVPAWEAWCAKPIARSTARSWRRGRRRNNRTQLRLAFGTDWAYLPVHPDIVMA